MRRISNRQSIPRNMLIIVLAVAMLLIAFIAYRTYRAYQQAAIDLVLQRDGQVAQLSAVRLSAELSNFSDILIDLARTNAMFNGEQREQIAALRGAAPRLSVFDGGVLLLDNQGFVIASEPVRGDMLNQDLSKREYFRALLRSSAAFISDSVADGPDGRQTIAIAVPIQGTQGEFVGGLVGFFELGEEVNSSFYASLVRLRLGQTGSTFLFDGQARILFDSESQRVGHFLTTQQLTQMAAIRQQGPLRTVDESNNEIVAALAPVPNTQWTLVIEDDWRILTSSTRRYSNMFFLSLAIGVLLPPVGVSLLARQRRVRELINARPPDEREFASFIRQQILPQKMPMLPGWDLAVQSINGAGTSQEVFDATILADGRLLVSIARAESATVENALALTKVHALLRSSAERQLAPPEAMAQCNRMLTTTSMADSRISSLYLVLDPVAGTFHYCNAGQAPPILGQHLLAHSEWSLTQSDALGSSFKPDFEGGRGTVQPGEILLLASRPALAARGQHGEAFIDDVLLDILAQPPESLRRLGSILASEYRAFTATLSQPAPELTLILIQRLNENGGIGTSL